MLNFAQLKFLLTGLTLLTVLAACSDDNTSTEAPPATIEITELTPETDKVSFRLIPTNAVSMAYKIEIEGEEADADFVSIESSEEKTVEITDLTPETAYKLTAIAYNADQRPSTPATEIFTTPKKPTAPDPDKATISIAEVNVSYNSVTFTLKTANATRFGYKVDVPDGTADLTLVNNSEGGTYTVDNLQEEADYLITAVAYDENGQATDPVTYAFKTEALPTGPAAVSIEEVATSHSSIRFTLKLENTVRIAYKVDVPDGTAEMTVVEKPQQSTFLVGSLQAETDYVLTVVAYNGKDEPSEPATHSFTTPAYTAFARIDAVATAHGIYLKAEVDNGKYPLYFLKIFDPDLTESSADFGEHFKVDSREQFIHYLEVASLTAGLKTASFEEWNKTLLSTRSQQVLLYAAPVVRQGVDVVCEDYGEIIEIPLTIPARDELGAGQAAVTLGEPQVAGKELEIALTKQDGVVSYYAGYATKSDVEAAGTPEQFVQAGLDAKTYDYDITADFQGTWKTDRLSPGSEYYFFSFAYDAEGKLGPLQYKEFHTEAAGTDYDTSLTVDIALKTASFTSATFSVKRNGFEKAYYNFITKADFDRKYGGNADTYVQRELIGKESGYPITLYSDNDINGSRLAYDTQYVLIALPEADNEDRYGVPTVVEFETLGYEATGSATATIAVNSITDNYGVSFYASVTVTPGADCAGYYYAMIEKTAYDAAANLGETICKQNGVKYRAATEDTTFSTDYYFAESYLVLIPVDNNGKMSAPVTSELLTTSAK